MWPTWLSRSVAYLASLARRSPAALARRLRPPAIARLRAVRFAAWVARCPSGRCVTLFPRTCCTDQ
eukprot:1549695-Pyramimonas_sp.AAC.1